MNKLKKNDNELIQKLIDKSSLLPLLTKKEILNRTFIDKKELNILSSNCRYSPQKGTEKLYSIYLITILTTNEKYIGKDSSGTRFRSYTTSTLTGISNNIKKAIKKHGRKNCEFKILEFVDNSNELSNREQYWIDKYGLDNLLNIYNSHPNKVPILIPKEWRKLVKKFKSNIRLVKKIKYWNKYTSNGYGIFELYINKEKYRFYAHRIAWVIHNRKINPNYQIPNGFNIRHKKGVARNCIDIKYLEPGTDHENKQDIIDDGNRKFTRPEIFSIRKYYLKCINGVLNPRHNYHQTKEAKKLNIPQSRLSAILNNQSYYDSNYIPPQNNTGVHYCIRDNIYRSSITIFKQKISLGDYSTELEAAKSTDAFILKWRPKGLHMKTNKERGLY